MVDPNSAPYSNVAYGETALLICILPCKHGIQAFEARTRPDPTLAMIQQAVDGRAYDSCLLRMACNKVSASKQPCEGMM